MPCWGPFVGVVVGDPVLGFVVGDPVLGFVVGDPVLGFVVVVVGSCPGLLMLWVVVVVVLPLRGTCGGTVLRSAVGPGPQSHLQFL